MDHHLQYVIIIKLCNGNNSIGNCYIHKVTRCCTGARSPQTWGSTTFINFIEGEGRGNQKQDGGVINLGGGTPLHTMIPSLLLSSSISLNVLGKGTIKQKVDLEQETRESLFSGMIGRVFSVRGSAIGGHRGGGQFKTLKTLDDRTRGIKPVKMIIEMKMCNSWANILL